MSTLATGSLESFRTAVGALSPVEVILEGPESGERVVRTLDQPFALVGRDSRADLQLDDWHVSRRHTFLQVLDGHWFAIDLQSQTGTHWSTGAQRSGWVNAAHGIQIGPYRLRAARVPETLPTIQDPLNERVPELLFLPRVTLDFLAGGVQQSSWRMNRQLALIGQAPDCKVRLVAPNVSKFHAVLVWTRVGLWAVDLCGRNGIRVNNRSVRVALLQQGELLEVGQFVIRIRYEAPPIPPEAPRHPAAEAAHSGERNGNATSGLSSLMLAEPRPVVLLATDSSQSEAAVVERLLVPLVNEFRLMQQQMFDQFQQAMTSMFNMFTSMHREQSDLIRNELDRLHQLTQELHELQAQLAQLPPREAPAMERPVATPPPRPVPAAPELPPRHEPQANGTPSPIPPLPRQTEDVGNPDQIHAWLTHRMASIQRERQSSWQKIMNFLLGSGPSS